MHRITLPLKHPQHNYVLSKRWALGLVCRAFDLIGRNIVYSFRMHLSTTLHISLYVGHIGHHCNYMLTKSIHCPIHCPITIANCHMYQQKCYSLYMSNCSFVCKCCITRSINSTHKINIKVFYHCRIPLALSEVFCSNNDVINIALFKGNLHSITLIVFIMFN